MHRFFFFIAAALMFAAPAFAGTWPAHFQGALLNGDTSVRLQRAAVYFQADAPSFGELPVEQMSRDQLQVEYQRLDREMPGIGGPIAMTSVGGGLVLLALGFLYVAVSAFVVVGGGSSYAVLGYIFLVFSAAAGITGAILLTVGLVKLFTRVGERRTYSQRMDDINARLESLDRTGVPPPPPPPDSVPPPPPPPGAGFFDVKPQYVVATF